jgi:mono/diheme cytochrome c family protein
LGAAQQCFFARISNSDAVHSRSQPDFKGKKVFEAKCATCHGLDGLGGEHAPDIVRRLAVKALSDEALLDVIHEGITEEGMPRASQPG